MGVIQGLYNTTLKMSLSLHIENKTSIYDRFIIGFYVNCIKKYTNNDFWLIVNAYNWEKTPRAQFFVR